MTTYTLTKASQFVEQKNRKKGKIMSRKNIEINDIMFELYEAKDAHTSDFYRSNVGCNIDEIFECYGRPSSTKVSIWADWCEWCREINESGGLCHIKISSHNCMMFSITGFVIDSNDNKFLLWITRDHNRAYICK